MNVYPFIAAEQAGEHSVKRACELLEVSRSAFYVRDRQSTRERVDVQLTEQIRVVHAASSGTYGAPRIHAELAAVSSTTGTPRELAPRGCNAPSPRGQAKVNWLRPAAVAAAA